MTPKRPSDAELAELLRRASEALRVKSPNVRKDFSDLVTAREMADTADALEAGSADTFEQKVERAHIAYLLTDNDHLSEASARAFTRSTDLRPMMAALRAAGVEG